MEEKQNTSSIELQSKKVRSIMGDIPNGLLYWGITVIVIIIALLVVVVLCVPYPYSSGESIFHHIFG